MRQRKIVVVGAGASGMMAAITAAGLGCRVILLDVNDRVGRKLLATGNGKCNFTNRDLEMGHYYGGSLEIPAKILEIFGLKETIDFFEGLGMLVRERNGCLYPASEQASTVLDLLRLELDRLQVDVRCKEKVVRISKNREGFLIHTKNGKTPLGCDRVVLACGGCAAPAFGSDGSGYQLAKAFGHAIVPSVPALVQLCCRDKDLKSVAGVRSQAKIKLSIEGRETPAEQGELQLTEYGISGIVVFQLSRLAAGALAEGKKVSAFIDLLPEWKLRELEQILEDRKKRYPQRTLEEFMTGILHKKLIFYFLRRSGLRPAQKVCDTEPGQLEKLFVGLKNWELRIQGTKGFENAQVSAGGVAFEGVTEGLESRKVPGVFFAGELLDVDGKCGGYNLQWAWSSGYVAGKNAAEG